MCTSRLYFGCSSTDPENEFKVSPVLCRAPNSLGSLNADDGAAIRILPNRAPVGSSFISEVIAKRHPSCQTSWSSPTSSGIESHGSTQTSKNSRIERRWVQPPRRRYPKGQGSVRCCCAERFSNWQPRARFHRDRRRDPNRLQRLGRWTRDCLRPCVGAAVCDVGLPDRSTLD